MIIPIKMGDVRAKKHLGQHFLTDPIIAENIADSVLSEDIPLLEIGPGTGMLTRFLLKRSNPLKVIELDRESVQYLKENFDSLENNIIEKDFLKAELSDIWEGQFGIIGNFPYNISSQIVFKILANRDQIPFMAGMFQKEVAERIISPEGSKKYGILSVLVQTWFETEYLFTVHEHVFSPMPKVKSGVIRISRKSENPVIENEKYYFSLIKTAFNQRRKTLRNALKPLLGATEVPEEYAGKRAEQLNYKDFIKLMNQVMPH